MSEPLRPLTLTRLEREYLDYLESVYRDILEACRAELDGEPQRTTLQQFEDLKRVVEK